MSSEPTLVSFVLRFVTDEPPLPDAAEAAPAARWRGVVRHVQSDAEQHFARWEEAVAFIAQWVALEAGHE